MGRGLVLDSVDLPYGVWLTDWGIPTQRGSGGSPVRAIDAEDGCGAGNTSERAEPSDLLPPTKKPCVVDWSRQLPNTLPARNITL